MSHISTIDLEIKDLESLKKACPSLGLEFLEGVTKYKWYGRSVGDYPLPQGFSKEELGACEHVLKIKGNDAAYQVGVCRRRDGKPGYTLLWDFWAGGFGLKAAIGENGGLLKQSYAKQVAIKQAYREGYKITEEKDASGAWVLTASR